MKYAFMTPCQVHLFPWENSNEIMPKQPAFGKNNNNNKKSISKTRKLFTGKNYFILGK